MKRVIGIDYSFTCPALCCLMGATALWWVNYKLKGRPYPPLPNVEWTPSTIDGDVCRFIELADWVEAVVRIHQPELIVLEDYAFMANGRITQLAENVGVLKARLSLFTIPLQLVAPTAMKKFATGKGNANKDDIWSAFITQYSTAEGWAAQCHPKAARIGSPVADIADAYFLAQYGRHHTS